MCISDVANCWFNDRSEYWWEHLDELKEELLRRGRPDEADKVQQVIDKEAKLP